jgi:formylglycine-generating enzyme required for sulfatase activity
MGVRSSGFIGVSMKKLIALFILVSLLPMFAFGQTKEFIKPYKYTASNDDSRNSAKAKAMEEAQISLLQEIGVLVEARQKMTTKTSDGSVQQDFIEEAKTYTLGKVQTTIVTGTEKFTEDDKGNMVYSATFKMLVDTVDLYNHLDNIVKQKENARADSLKRANKISELETAAKAAKKILNDEQQTEKPLEIEMENAEIEKKDAEKAYNNATNTRNEDRIKFELGQLKKAEVKYNTAHRDWSTANQKVKAAENNLNNIEAALAKERGLPFSASIHVGADKTQSANNSLNLPTSKTISGIECVLVKAGNFKTSSGKTVTLTKDFYISKYPVTQAQYRAITGNNPSKFRGDDKPVEIVTWENANDFCKKVGGFLPTETQWEFAARGGNKSRGYIYSGSNNLDEVGWCSSNSSKQTHNVGQKNPNELGIYDMSGDVWEWTVDWYQSVYPSGSMDPKGANIGSYRVIRGGSWYNYEDKCLVSIRKDGYPANSNNRVGFRVAFPAN